MGELATVMEGIGRPGCSWRNGVAMEKILQIIAVFAVMMLVIALFFRGREARYRPYGYLRRMKPSLPEEVRRRLVAAITGPAMEDQRMRFPVDGEADALLFDAETRLLFIYKASGSLVIYRQAGPQGGQEAGLGAGQGVGQGVGPQTGQDVYKEMQWLAAPLDCAGFYFDPDDKHLYFEAAGSLFVFGC
jgi:hypothetical protein